MDMAIIIFMFVEVELSIKPNEHDVIFILFSTRIEWFLSMTISVIKLIGNETNKEISDILKYLLLEFITAVLNFEIGFICLQQSFLAMCELSKSTWCVMLVICVVGFHWAMSGDLPPVITVTDFKGAKSKSMYCSQSIILCWLSCCRWLGKRWTK